MVSKREAPLIRARIALDESGGLIRFDAGGHSGTAEAGRDIVCAAFSALARTAYKALEASPGAVVEGSAPEPGLVSFRVIRPGDDRGRAAGIADCLVIGVGDLAREYPEAVAVSIERVLEE